MMLTRWLARPSLRVLRPTISAPRCSCNRSLPRRISTIPLHQRHHAGLRIRHYSEAAKTRLEEEGVPLHNSGPTTAALLAYAEAHWLPPADVPTGWSVRWRDWDYLLTLFAYSPYFLRLPQIEMLVNVKYAISGEVRPIMYSDAREALVFLIDRPLPGHEDGENEPARQTDGDAEEDAAGAAEVFYLNCRTFDLYMYDIAHAENAPDTIEELVRLIGTAPTPADVPLMPLTPDRDGVAALQRILDRDASVIPVLARDFLAYTPRATEPAEELVSADEADAARRDRLADAIRTARGYIKETEEELVADEKESMALREAAGGAGLHENEGLKLDERAHLQMRAALEESKAKLGELEQMWTTRYGEWHETKSQNA